MIELLYGDAVTAVLLKRSTSTLQRNERYAFQHAYRVYSFCSYCKFDRRSSGANALKLLVPVPVGK